MRILLVDPGAEISTVDVFRGLERALVRAGVEVFTFALQARLDFACEYLQLAWERRKGHEPDAPKPSGADVAYLACSPLLERAAWYQPDAVLSVSGMYLAPQAILDLRRLGYLVATLLTESPYNDDVQARICAFSSLVFTNERASLLALRRINPETHYLPHAYDAERHRWGMPRSSHVASHDVVFVGSGFAERRELLSAVDWRGIDLGLYGFWGPAANPAEAPTEGPLAPYVRGGPVDNAVATALYRRAKIGLNLYRSSVSWDGGERVTGGESLNPRAYELAACGAFTISEHRPEVTEKFGDLVPTFRTAAELETLLRRYLADGGSRAFAAHRLPVVVAHDSWDDRARGVLEHIERVLAREQKER